MQQGVDLVAVVGTHHDQPIHAPFHGGADHGGGVVHVVFMAGDQQLVAQFP